MSLISIHYAREIVDAEERIKTLPPLSVRNGKLTIDDAHYIQLELVKLKSETGHKVIGKKVGLLRNKIKASLNRYELTYGHLFHDMEIANFSIIEKAVLQQPKILPKFGFFLKDELFGPHVTFLDVLMATEYVVPALEIIDTRYNDWDFQLIDSIADNGSSAKFIVGESKKTIDEINLRTNGVMLTKNNAIIATGASSLVIGHPAEAIASLVNTLSRYHMGLNKGELILSGSFSAAMNVETGDYFVVDFGILGKVGVLFK